MKYIRFFGYLLILTFLTVVWLAAQVKEKDPPGFTLEIILQDAVNVRRGVRAEVTVNELTLKTDISGRIVFANVPAGDQLIVVHPLQPEYLDFRWILKVPQAGPYRFRMQRSEQ